MKRFNINILNKCAALLMIFLLLLSLVACNSAGKNDSESSDDYSITDGLPFDETEPRPTDVPETSDTGTAQSDNQVSSNTPETTTNAQPDESDQPEEKSDGLTATQRNSINMLNYMTALIQKVDEERNNQLFLESAYDSFDNLYPNSVDTETNAQVDALLDTIQNYRMIAEKRERLQFIYEQNRAQAMRKAIPNPVSLLNVVQSGSLLKAAVSVLYMAIDSATSYQEAASQADLQFIKDGWELDDKESAELHNSNKNRLNYLFTMVRNYDLPGDYALSKSSIEDFVAWSKKPDTQLVSKISWFESHQDTYSEYGPYWLEIAKDYYNQGEYEKCLNATKKYEKISTRIFRDNIDFASVLPMTIVSAKETLNQKEYISEADRYCKIILEETKDSDFSLRYFVAQIYIDLYSITNNNSFLDQAYEIAYNNVNVLADKQRASNAAYLSEIKKAKAKDGASKREKQEVKDYNEALEEERKIALPPVDEAFYLNCDLLFALSKEKNISKSEKDKIEAILHVEGETIFLADIVDSRFWFSSKNEIKTKDISIDFDGKTIKLPATCVTDRSVLTVTISNGDTINDWKVDNVKRPKGADCSEYVATFKSDAIKKHKYQVGETLVIKITPVASTPEEIIEFNYNVVEEKKAVIFDGIGFERVN